MSFSDKKYTWRYSTITGSWTWWISRGMAWWTTWSLGSQRLAENFLFFSEREGIFQIWWKMTWRFSGISMELENVIDTIYILWLLWDSEIDMGFCDGFLISFYWRPDHHGWRDHWGRTLKFHGEANGFQLAKPTWNMAGWGNMDFWYRVIHYIDLYSLST